MKLMLTALLALLPLVPQDLPHAFPRDGATQLFDNERVTIWDVTWIKGEPSPMHRHRYDLVGVYLVGSAITITMPDGTARESVVDPDFVLFQPKGVTHIEEGAVDENPRHAILIDVKDHVAAPVANTSGFPDAFPRDGARKVIDNERVVIWDYRWTAGEPTPMHFHGRDVVAVFLDEGELRSTTPDGRSDVTRVTRGLANFTPGNRTHTEALVSGTPRIIAVELK